MMFTSARYSSAAIGLAMAFVVVACSGAPEPSASVGPGASPEPTSSPLAVGGATPTISATPTFVPSPQTTLAPTALPPTSVPATPAPATPAASPTSAPPVATAGPDGWTGPTRIARRFFDDLALAVDGDGAAHVAAASNAGIVYFTNQSGSWTRQRITTAPDGGYDGRPEIAVDGETIVVAFARYAEWFCFGIGCAPQDFVGNFQLIGSDRGWSDPGAIPHLGDMAVRDGVTHFAFEGPASNDGSSVVYAVGSG